MYDGTFKIIPRELEHLASEWANCLLCRLVENREQIVFGVGRYTTPLVIIGQAPGKDEDEAGVPFIGRAGQFIQEAFDEIGFDMGDAFVTNLVACFPPRNRVPLPSEVEPCRRRFDEAILILKPRIVLAVGGVAMAGLMGLTGIGKNRGRVASGYVFDRDGERHEVKALATFHPAGLLRSHDKKDIDLFKQDLKLALDTARNGVV